MNIKEENQLELIYVDKEFHTGFAKGLGPFIQQSQAKLRNLIENTELKIVEMAGLNSFQRKLIHKLCDRYRLCREVLNSLNHESVQMNITKSPESKLAVKTVKEILDYKKAQQEQLSSASQEYTTTEKPKKILARPKKPAPTPAPIPQQETTCNSSEAQKSSTPSTIETQKGQIVQPIEKTVPKQQETNNSSRGIGRGLNPNQTVIEIDPAHNNTVFQNSDYDPQFDRRDYSSYQQEQEYMMQSAYYMPQYYYYQNYQQQQQQINAPLGSFHLASDAKQSYGMFPAQVIHPAQQSLNPGYAGQKSMAPNIAVPWQSNIPPHHQQTVALRAPIPAPQQVSAPISSKIPPIKAPYFHNYHQSNTGNTYVEKRPQNYSQNNNQNTFNQKSYVSKPYQQNNSSQNYHNSDNSSSTSGQPTLQYRDKTAASHPSEASSTNNAVKCSIHQGNLSQPTQGNKFKLDIQDFPAL